MSKWVNGYVHENPDTAFMAHVQIVTRRTAEHRAGCRVGYMEFTDGTEAEVYMHTSGSYYGFEITQ